MSTTSTKRGDTLTLSCVRTDAAGDPVDLSGTTIEAEMVRGATRQALTVTVTDAAAGAFTLSLPPATTDGLATGLWRADIQYTEPSGAVTSSDTFSHEVVEDITGAD